LEENEMDRIQIALNLRKPGNYAFFCPVSRLHLTRSNPVGYVDGVTSAILTGLRFKTLLDVDGVVDLETGKVVAKAANSNKEEIKTETPAQQEEPEAPVEAPEAPKTEVTEEPKEEQVEQKEDESEAPEGVTEGTPAEEPKKRGRKASK
jgi:hypothetical protein